MAAATRKVAIIGAGSAGLGAAVELLAISTTTSGSAQRPTNVRFEPTILERRPHLGGIWQYEDPGECTFLFDSRGVAHPVSSLTATPSAGAGQASMPGPTRTWQPSPMYEGLRTNIPRDLMCFPDFQDAQQVQDGKEILFPPRGEVQRYLEAYAAEHGLEKYIRYDTDVVSVERVRGGQAPDGGRSQWRVEARRLATRDVTEEIYDYVVFAGGRCNRPKIPFVPGLWLFKGTLLHSAWYRTPTAFRGQSVLIVGNNSSGMDIARELNGKVLRRFEGVDEWVADASADPPRTGVRVRQSVEDITKPPPADYDPRDESSPAWSRAIEVVPRITRVEAGAEASSKGRIVLEDGRVLDDVQTILFATGFSYEFPALDQSRPPFDHDPVLPPPPPADLDASSQAELASRRAALGEDMARVADTLPRASPYMSNLDAFQLFYRLDPSIVFPGIPTAIVPFHFTQIQMRYVAHFWAGLVPALPALDPAVPVGDEHKWTSISQETEAERAARSMEPVQHLLAHPSDFAYLDQLLVRIHGSAAHSPVDELETDGKGGIHERGPEDSYLTTRWRRERRVNGKSLRRAELGY